MIIETLENASLYDCLHPGISKAIQYLRFTDFTNMADGKYEINGDSIFAVITGYTTKAYHEGKWEAHKKYIDVQYIIKGREQIFWAPLEYMQIIEPYNLERDVMFLKGEGEYFTLSEGMFAVFFPTDAHLPCISVDEPALVRKVVIKVKMK